VYLFWGNSFHQKPIVPILQVEFVGNVLPFDFLFFHKIYLRTINNLRTMNNLQGEYSSLSIISTYEVGCISTFPPYWLHHIGYK
jgi:hypothetical protein